MKSENYALHQQIHADSISQPEQFWTEAAQGLVWNKPWDRVLDDSNAPLYSWFVGGELNTCYNAVDRHVEGEEESGLLLNMLALLQRRHTPLPIESYSLK